MNSLKTTLYKKQTTGRTTKLLKRMTWTVKSITRQPLIIHLTLKPRIKYPVVEKYLT